MHQASSSSSLRVRIVACGVSRALREALEQSVVDSVTMLYPINEGRIADEMTRDDADLVLFVCSNDFNKRLLERSLSACERPIEAPRDPTMPHDIRMLKQPRYWVHMCRYDDDDDDVYEAITDIVAKWSHI